MSEMTDKVEISVEILGSLEFFEKHSMYSQRPVFGQSVRVEEHTSPALSLPQNPVNLSPLSLLSPTVASMGNETTVFSFVRGNIISKSFIPTLDDLLFIFLPLENWPNRYTIFQMPGIFYYWVFIIAI